MEPEQAKAAVCLVVGCDRRHYGRGYCNMHWQRWRRFGDPAVVVAAKGRPLNERLARWSQDSDTGCRVWVGHTNEKGYGHLRVGGRMRAAHRLSYELHYGPIPAGMHVCHRCDNPSCINHLHLFLGTNGDNVRDKVAKGRQARKVTENDVTAMRYLFAFGWKQSEIGECFGISQSQVSRRLRGCS